VAVIMDGNGRWATRRGLPRSAGHQAGAHAVRRVIEAAPGIVHMLDRMGVPFNRTAEGLLDFRRFGGSLFHRTAFAGATTGQQLTSGAVDSTGVAVKVRVIRLDPGYSEIGILNEQSAAFNDFAADGSPTHIDGQFGNWEPVTGAWARLRSSSLGVEWSLPSIAGAQLHGGRELSPPDFNWAGLDYLFRSTFAGTTYHINVQEAR